MGYGGYLVKIGTWTVPFEYISAESFQAPLLGQDKDSYNDDNGELHRTALANQVEKVEWQLPSMDEEKLRNFYDHVEKQYVNKREKKCMCTAYVSEIGKYVSMYCYVPDITPVVVYADEKTVKYAAHRFALIGYGGKVR